MVVIVDVVAERATLTRSGTTGAHASLSVFW